MAFEINKTELVWPGKYDEEGNLVQPPRVSLPFQVIERVNETRATREAKKAAGLTLFDVWDGKNEGSTFEDGWRNKLIWGENSVIMSSLLATFAGRFQMIYIDPPFDVGADFSVEIEIGDEQITKSANVLEEVAYRDTWGKGSASYIAMMRIRLAQARGLLSEKGFLLLHCDWRVSSLLRLIGDEVFGTDNYRNEVVWSYRTGGAGRGHSLPRKHDTIHVWASSEAAAINSQQERQYLEKPFMGSKTDSAGRHYVDTILRDCFEGVINLVVNEDEIEQLSVRPVLNLSSERTGYPTQKPVGLLGLLTRIFSNPGDLVGDFFMGSGTTAEAAEKLGRRWICSDIGRFALHTTRKRILGVEKCRPFEILNLGKYERQFWSSANFGEDLDGDGEVNLLEYIAFILKAYGAEPFAGSALLHGKKGDAYIHVGSVSSPVTIADIEAAAQECSSLKGKKLHVLGWEWEMGLHDPVVSRAKRDLGIDLALRQIPNEVMEAEAVKKGQVKFFDLAYVEVEVEPKGKSGEFVCTLKDFSTPNTDLVPEEVRKQITKWSDYVDYWAIDWNFQNDTFKHDFVDYRTRQDRSLKLKSDPHTYEKPGTYQVLVKVIDIFGNDTSTIIELKVK